jgi:hypothetical protein
MSSVQLRAALALVTVLAMSAPATAQVRPYIGYVYPAGGQQGKTFQLKLGGQNLDGAKEVVVTGKGVTGRVIQYLRKLGPQEMTLLREQLDALKMSVHKEKWDKLTEATQVTDTMAEDDVPVVTQETLSRLSALGVKHSGSTIDPEKLGIDPEIVGRVIRIRSRIGDYVQRPASAAISSLVLAEVTVAPDAQPGQRELRIIGERGPSNPMVFYVGQLPEVSRTPMVTSEQQVLGKEALALRRRGRNVERTITVPCTLNGQIASGEVHRYRFKARAGQRLVISTVARELVPFIADAVPGWFQPELAVYNAQGKEVAYSDRFYFNPDPIIAFKVPEDGEYVLAINDAIYRGREDFVYRVTIDESLLVTSIFPLGAKFGTSPPITMKGWNLEGATLSAPTEDSETGYHVLKATKSHWESNRVLFAPDTLPECSDTEPNDDQEHAQKVQLPMIVNGRIDRPDDHDVLQFAGRAGEKIVAEVKARRLGSPLDSVLTLTDARGALLAVNDDYDDPEAGTVTHYADSYLTFTLPSDGTYFLQIADTTRSGGEEYAYRLRISRPRPDFALRVVPSGIVLRSGGGSDTVSIFVYRREGFAEPITVTLSSPPPGISSDPLVIEGNEPIAKLTIRSDSEAKPGLFDLVVHGTAKIGSAEVTYEAVPAEDRMQAFLWRHLVPAKDLKAFVPDPNADDAKPRRRHKIAAAAAAAAATPPAGQPAGKPKFTKAQVAGRLRQLDRLFDEGLLTEEFYRECVAECEAGQ